PYRVSKQGGTAAHRIAFFDRFPSCPAEPCAHRRVVNQDPKVFEPFLRRRSQEAVFAVTYHLAVGPRVRADGWYSHRHILERLERAFAAGPGIIRHWHDAHIKDTQVLGLRVGRPAAPDVRNTRERRLAVGDDAELDISANDQLSQDRGEHFQ